MRTFACSLPSPGRVRDPPGRAVSGAFAHLILSAACAERHDTRRALRQHAARGAAPRGFSPRNICVRPCPAIISARAGSGSGSTFRGSPILARPGVRRGVGLVRSRAREELKVYAIPRRNSLRCSPIGLCPGPRPRHRAACASLDSQQALDTCSADAHNRHDDAVKTVDRNDCATRQSRGVHGRLSQDSRMRTRAQQSQGAGSICKRFTPKSSRTERCPWICWKPR